MRANSREEVRSAFDAFAAGLDRVIELDFDALTTPEQLRFLERWERARRRMPTVDHQLINQIAAQADPAELGGKLPWAIADRLLITRGEARRRIDEAAELGERRSLTGKPLEPVLPATAAAQRAGRLGGGHVAVIRGFHHHLPDDVDIETRQITEEHLASYATGQRPDELAKFAHQLFDAVVPDGLFSDVERARRRAVIIGPQDRDGMSPIKGYLDPEGRATLDAVLARWAAPGMCNPGDDIPCLAGTPSQTAIESDTRGAGQRNHDALTALGRAMLASGGLGQHNGLPASIIVSTTLTELEAGTGKAHTGGGTWLPMSDVIRLASHAHHYLRIHHKSKELALFHTKRIASPGQRIVLYAKDRGCTRPRCTVPGYLTEVHHVTPWKDVPQTDIHDLTLGCGPDHELATTGGWITRKRKDGLTEWIPPAHLDHGQTRTNNFHHPERLLRESADSDDDPDDP